MKSCKVEGCDRPVAGRGLCHMHYKRWARHGDPEVTMVKKECKVAGCERRHFCKGYCEPHYRRMRKEKALEEEINQINQQNKI
ncbi:hypothetical protein QUF79_14755 [Fictibacillus enclensis]|uniref:hypothetical protein n=1 Tax=Fictibacillus enclensis TaxID=1017270 RepID=UPI0025A0D04A|nr:hypothetical protein [Fictibacillus enclensis]MDM5199278.1 hypothetical protein [Fictibacillus enclensis]